MIRLISCPVLISLSTFPVLSSAAIVFSDSDFPDSSWSETKIFDSTGTQTASLTAQQETSGGNPGNYREFALTVPHSGDGSSQGIIASHLRAGAEYAPSSQGAIESIDFSFDARTISQVGSSAEPFLSLIIHQSGSWYQPGVSAVSAGSWVDISLQDLSASDFSLAVGSGPSIPDFSSSGSLIQFGFWTSTAGTSSTPIQFTITGGIDNWNVRVEQAAAAPSPNVLALIALGIPLLGYTAARRRCTQKNRRLL